MLTEKEIRNAKPADRAYKLYDGNGLLVRIKPTGSKTWEFKYRVAGAEKRKEKLLALGSYPEVTLKRAREKCLDARKLLQEGKDPGELRRAAKRIAKFNAENDFEAVAKEWYKTQLPKWSPRYGKKLWKRLEVHVLPSLRTRSIVEIDALELLEVIRAVERQKHKRTKRPKLETAQRVLRDCRAIFQHAVLCQKIKYNPAADLHRVLQTYECVNLPTIGDNQIPDFLEKLEMCKTSEITRLATKLLILTFVRQGELRKAKWSDIRTDSAEWRIRPETTKMRELHHVPLSSQSLAVLRELSLLTGCSEYLFPSQNKQKNPFMSENTINNLIHEMGYKGQLVGHGFRAMASTILNEKGFRPDVIERQLAHMPRDKVRAAYNRAQYLEERREMMQWWGDHIESAGMKFASKVDAEPKG